jgi:ELWxxDGT repeat protein
MRPIHFRQLLTASLRRLSQGTKRRARVRSGPPETLETRVLLTAPPVTPQATLVKDINPTGNSDPGGAWPAFASVNNTIFFAATDGTSGKELWKSDGTLAGTVLVRNINPSGNSYPRGITNVNGTVYFRASDGDTGSELWKSDGTSAGTSLVNDIHPTGGSYPSALTNLNGTLYFVAENPTYGRELWKSNGTSEGTILVKDIRSGSGGAFGTQPSLWVFNNTLYFAANDGSSGFELWKSDGTSAGTMLVKDIKPGGDYPGSSFPDFMTNVNGTLFFSAGGNEGRELWKTDGNPAGTSLVMDIHPTDGSYPSALTNLNGTLYFSANNGTEGYELWTSNGTPSGTVMVKDIRSDAGSSSPTRLTNLDGTLYFRADDGTHGKELWKSNGTAAGTVLVRDINVNSNASSYPGYLTNVEGILYFRSNDGTNGYELWRSDGTSSGTVLVTDINPGSNGSWSYYLTNVNGTLFFQATSAATGAELWKVAPPSLNAAPTDIALSATSIAENQASGTAVGNFSTTDPDTGDTFTYTLVSGTGSTDNASFTIEGDSLKTTASFNFETKSSYSIRVRSTDQGGEVFEKQFTITVTDGNDGATQVVLSNVVTSLLATANTTSAIRLADVSFVDDGLGTNTLSLSGPDASTFELVSGQLRLKAGTVLNYDTKKTYSVTVNVDDTTVGGTPDASVDYTLSLQGYDGITVQNGSAGRSYVRYVTLTFGTSQGLADAVASMSTPSPRIRLLWGAASGKVWTPRTLTSSMVSTSGNQLLFDFGPQGVGGVANSSVGDGLYRLRVDLDGSVDSAGKRLSEVVANFFRLFGDADGNGIVNQADVTAVTQAQGLPGLYPGADLDGDGDVDADDLNNVKKRLGARVWFVA